MLLIRSLTVSFDDESKEALEENMKEWQRRRQGGQTYESGGASNAKENNVVLPLGQGEWDEPLGLPLCLVCQNVRSRLCEEVLRCIRSEC